MISSAGKYMNLLRTCLRLALLAVLFPLVATAAVQDAAKRSGEAGEFFEKKIRPVLFERCYQCHSTGADKDKGGLRLDSRTAILKGGDSGPAIVPGDPEKSLLIEAIRHTRDDLKMPPKQEQRLTAAQVADFVTWVKMETAQAATADSA